MSDDDSILIAGAGIGGLAAAIALQCAGFSVRVFERADEVRALGAGISLWMNAMIALRQLGVESQIRASSALFDRSEIQTCTGKTIRTLPLESVSTKLGAFPVGIARSDLIRVLYEACGKSKVETRAQCVGFEQNADYVTLRLGDGRVIRGAALIGADGARSAIRNQLLNLQAPAFAGAVEWRGISDNPQGAEAESGSLFYVFSSEGSAGVGWYVSPQRVAWSIGTDSVKASRDYDPLAHQQSLTRLMHGWKGPLPALVANTPRERIHLSDYLQPVPVQKWGEGRVTLLGDAAHSIGTTLGQGGAQTLEDATGLAQSLTQCSDVVSGLRLYELQRRRRVQLAVKRVQTLRNLLSLGAETRLGRQVRSLAVRFMPGALINHLILRIMEQKDKESQPGDTLMSHKPGLASPDLPL